MGKISEEVSISQSISKLAFGNSKSPVTSVTAAEARVLIPLATVPSVKLVQELWLWEEQQHPPSVPAHNLYP